MTEQVLWTKTNPAIKVPHEIDLVASTVLPSTQLISCAFVIAVNTNGELLLTFDDRPGRGWDVPGGHLDTGETPSQAAVRELEEETGVVLSTVALHLIGWTRITLHQRPVNYHYPYPISYMAFYTAANQEAVDPPGPLPGTECSAARWMTLDHIREHSPNADWVPLITQQA